jgi:dienelactone hydrolase
MKFFKILKSHFTFCVILSSLFLVPTFVFSQVSDLKLNLNYGEYAVGFKSVNQYDLSRTYKPSKDEFGNLITGEGFRPVQTLIWYPAQVDEDSKSMLYEEYVYNYTNIENFVPNTEEIKKNIEAKIKKNLRVTEDVFLKALSLKTDTYKNSNSSKGSFPIIIYAPSWSNLAWENLSLCSYLASHGYIVAASPSFNKNSREMTDDVESLDAQAKDQEFLVNFMKDFPNADSSKIASLGYSWGATSNIIAAERQRQFDAIVCLDGAIEHWYTQYANGTPYLDPLKLNIPFFAMSLAPPSEEARRNRDMDSSFIFFESLQYSDAYRITFLKMAHHFFRGASQRFANYSTENDRSSLKERNDCYNIMCHYTLNFFNAHIKNDKMSEKWLKKTPEDHNIPKEFLSIEYKTAIK